MDDTSHKDRPYIWVEQSNEPQTAILKLNMKPYLDAFKAYQADMREDTKKHPYEIIRSKLVSESKDVNGQLCWVELLTEATKNLTQAEIDLIYASPACTFMNNNFVELLKNAMDEAILSHLEKPIELEFSIVDDIHNPDHMIFTFKDTGRGFPEAFLKKTSTRTGRDDYIMGSGSSKQRVDSEENPSTDNESPFFDLSADSFSPDMLDRPALFGSAGRGLRMLIANVDYGQELLKSGVAVPKYIKPTVSHVRFGNRSEGNGAVITLVTSKTPMKNVLKRLRQRDEESIEETNLAD